MPSTKIGFGRAIVPIVVVAVCWLLASAAALGATEEVAVLTTPRGEIVWRFLPGAAPGHVSYVKELIRRGFYDGTTFHRVIPHFVIQGGDPNSRNADRSDDGEGEADRRLTAEFSTSLHYRPGTVGMARDVDPDSGSCQFFIALENLPRLDGRYTIFGELIEGLDVARRIAETPRDVADNPLEPMRITARIEKRRVPERIRSAEAGESGEVLTGPDKPEPFDPGNVLWSAPRRISTGEGGVNGPEERPVVRFELVSDDAGRVLDVRFPALDTPGAAQLREEALGWRFQPALYAGAPRKVRFEIDSDGGNIGPPLGPGFPVELSETMAPPRPVVRVDLHAGETEPAGPARLRLNVGEDGRVREVAIQTNCGDPALDARAVDAALKLLFEPATRPAPEAAGGGRVPAAVYLDVEARFVRDGD